MTNIQTLVPVGPSYIDYGYLVEEARITDPEFKVMIPKLMPKIKGNSTVTVDKSLFVNDTTCMPSLSGVSLNGYILVKSLADHRTEHYGDNMSGDTGKIKAKGKFKWSSGETNSGGPGPHTHPVSGKTYEGEVELTVSEYSLDHPYYINLNQIKMKKGTEVIVIFIGNSLDQAYLLNLPQCVVGQAKPCVKGGLYVHQ